MRDDVVLTLDGTEHRGWTSVSVARSLETMAGTFTLGMTDPRTGTEEPRPFSEFQAVTLHIGDELVMRGIVDDVAPSYDATSHSVSLSGRSLTGQLECAAVIETGELRDVSLDSVATRLCEPLGVSVLSAADAAQEAFDRVEIEPGETVADVLERLARQRGVFLTDNAAGNLVITRRGDTVQGRIVEGKGGNVAALKCSFNGTRRFSDVTVKGQRTGSDTWSAVAASAPVGRAKDASIPLHRPMVLLSETQGDSGALEARAQHEVALRKGQGRQWVYELTGWRREDGALWEAGQLVEVLDPMVALDADLLAVEVALTLDAEGKRTEIAVAQPEGYDLRAIPETKEESTGWT